MDPNDIRHGIACCLQTVSDLDELRKRCIPAGDGLIPRGMPGPVDHQELRRVRIFKILTGQAVQNRDMSIDSEARSLRPIRVSANRVLPDEAPAAQGILLGATKDE